jgi:hypothetical protein
MTSHPTSYWARANYKPVGAARSLASLHAAPGVGQTAPAKPDSRLAGHWYEPDRKGAERRHPRRRPSKDAELLRDVSNGDRHQATDRELLHSADGTSSGAAVTIMRSYGACSGHPR